MLTGLEILVCSSTHRENPGNVPWNDFLLEVPGMIDCTFTDGIHPAGNNITYASHRKASYPTNGKWLLKLISLRVKSRKISAGFMAKL
jgi:hypothetical protein